MTQLQNHSIDIFTNLHGTFSLGFLCFFIALTGFCLFFYYKPNPQQENRFFGVFSFLLVIFSLLRPMGIARDDIPGYVGWAFETCPLLKSYFHPEQCYFPSRDWAWHFLVRVLKSFMTGDFAILSISAAGVLIQLLIIYRLCRHRLLALTLFIPLVYMYYDFTFLRAGLALTAFFIGFYFLAQSQKILGSSILLGNYLFHSQGIFSIGVLPFHLIAKHKNASIAIFFILILLIFLKWTPFLDFASPISKLIPIEYWEQYQNGLFSGERIFPLTHLLIIGYVILILLVDKSGPLDNLLEEYSLGSICFAVFLAWFFAPIHAIQTRLFDFYLAPLVFMAGNLRLTKITLAATLGLSALLYIRMELLHNWIIG